MSASELTFTVEVEFTDRSISGGGFATSSAFVVVMAETDQEAMLIAAQMVVGSIPEEWMVVGTRVTGCVA